MDLAATEAGWLRGRCLVAPRRATSGLAAEADAGAPALVGRRPLPALWAEPAHTPAGRRSGSPEACKQLEKPEVRCRCRSEH